MSSRVARKPIDVAAGLEVRIDDAKKIVVIKGPKGELHQEIPAEATVSFENKQISIQATAGLPNADAIAGTLRAILNNHVKGVSTGFTKKLQLVGVGYRAAAGKAKDGRHLLNLTLGMAHPVSYIAPKGIELTTPSVTDIEVNGIDKQKVGQAAADIRGVQNGLRKPEPYKGKGIRYSDEVIILKETKKK